MKHINLAALTKRLEDHADGIENLAPAQWLTTCASPPW
jgi:hypothetical protein